jgi:hypothetical protein
VTNTDPSNPTGDHAFLHEPELTVQAELTLAGTSQAAGEAGGEPAAEWLRTSASRPNREVAVTSSP